MTTIRVAIPLLKGKRRFHLDKGRPWSLVEHVILAAIVKQARTVNSLANNANIPNRLILEIIIRLMRAGWVELSQGPEGVIFSASQAGNSVVDLEELPSTPRRITRWMNFLIDRISGTLYSSRELPFFEKHILLQREKHERLVWIEPRDSIEFEEANSIITTLLRDDEKFIAIEPSGDRLVDRYALVAVRNGLVEGLPARAPSELETLVIQAANSSLEKSKHSNSSIFRPEPPPPYVDRAPPQEIKAVFSSDDIILGGREHGETLNKAIRKARHRIIIHSTFIAEDKFSAIRHHLHDAVKRGVLIDILWGEDEEKTGTRTTKAVVERLRQQITAADLQSNIKIHPFSTGSHAKLIVADDGTDQLFAVVGSCNWLASSFESFGASIRLRDPKAVALILEQIAELTRGSDGHWTDLTTDMLRMSCDARLQRAPSGSRARITIVLGPQHAQFVRKARDEAVKRLFVTSHQLGAASRPAFIVPAIAAVDERGVEVRVYYGRPTGNIRPVDATRLTAAAADFGIRIRPVREPRLHAKTLAWDDDNLLVTSQNWLSADPSDANLRREIGIFIQGIGAARTVIERFEAVRQD